MKKAPELVGQTVKGEHLWGRSLKSLSHTLSITKRCSGLEHRRGVKEGVGEGGKAACSGNLSATENSHRGHSWVSHRPVTPELDEDGALLLELCS